MADTQEKSVMPVSDEEWYEAFVVYMNRLDKDVQEAVSDLPLNQRKGFRVAPVLTFEEFVQRIWHNPQYRPRWQNRLSLGGYEREEEAIAKIISEALANLKPSEYCPDYCI